MKQKQIQRVVVNVNQPTKPKRRRRAKKSAKKKQPQAPLFIPMPQSVIRYYDNTIPQRNIEIKPPVVEQPKILKGVNPETEYVAPVQAERKPIAVPTPNTDDEHVLLREEAPVEFTGDEAPSARDVIEEERPVEPPEPPEERPDGMTFELINKSPETTALGLADELDLAPQATALALTQEPPQQPLALRQPTLADWGGDASEFPLAPPAREAWGSLVPETSSLPINVVAKRERKLPPLQLPTLVEETIPEPTEPITFTFADTKTTARKPSGMRPPSEAPATARSIFEETPAQQSRADAEQRAEKERKSIEKVRKPKVEESEFVKKYKADFNTLNELQKESDRTAGYDEASIKRASKMRERSFKEFGNLNTFSIDHQLLERGFSPVGKGAVATAGGLLS